jgi:hypothetical protein
MIRNILIWIAVILMTCTLSFAATATHAVALVGQPVPGLQCSIGATSSGLNSKIFSRAIDEGEPGPDFCVAGGIFLV